MLEQFHPTLWTCGQTLSEGYVRDATFYQPKYTWVQHCPIREPKPAVPRLTMSEKLRYIV